MNAQTLLKEVIQLAAAQAGLTVTCQIAQDLNHIILFDFGHHVGDISYSATINGDSLSYRTSLHLRHFDLNDPQLIPTLARHLHQDERDLRKYYKGQ